jgi:hypothetical protein
MTVPESHIWTRIIIARTPPKAKKNSDVMMYRIPISL